MEHHVCPADFKSVSNLENSVSDAIASTGDLFDRNPQCLWKGYGIVQRNLSCISQMICQTQSLLSLVNQMVFCFLDFSVLFLYNRIFFARKKPFGKLFSPMHLLNALAME